jgi:hypothetical protein
LGALQFLEFQYVYVSSSDLLKLVKSDLLNVSELVGQALDFAEEAALEIRSVAEQVGALSSSRHYALESFLVEQSLENASLARMTFAPVLLHEAQVSGRREHSYCGQPLKEMIRGLFLRYSDIVIVEYARVLASPLLHECSIAEASSLLWIKANCAKCVLVHASSISIFIFLAQHRVELRRRIRPTGALADKAQNEKRR